MLQRLAMIGFSVAVFISGGGVAHAARDVVVTTSGDRLVGEIKSVEKDVLTLGTDYSDVDFKIKWDKVASIESDREFLIETFAGQRLSGALKPDPEREPAVTVGAAAVPLPEVSMAQPFERTLWSRFDVGVDFGSRWEATCPIATSGTSTHSSSACSGAHSPTRQRHSAGTSATTSAACLVPGGT
jgi:hypothetical protein